MQRITDAIKATLTNREVTELPTPAQSDTSNIVAGALLDFAGYLITQSGGVDSVDMELAASDIRAFAASRELDITNPQLDWETQLVTKVDAPVCAGSTRSNPMDILGKIVTMFQQTSIRQPEDLEDLNPNGLMPNGKPTIVEVIRYYRPRGPVTIDRMNRGIYHGDIDSQRGVTVLFTIDYQRMEFIARWSICNGDNFSKEAGVTFAQRCKTPIFNSFDTGRDLSSNLLSTLEQILGNRTSHTAKQKHDLDSLYNELLAA